MLNVLNGITGLDRLVSCLRSHRSMVAEPGCIQKSLPQRLCSELLSLLILRELLDLSPYIYFFFLSFFFFNLFIYYLWLCWVFVSVRGLSLVAASGGHSSSRRAGLSLSRPLLLRSTGSRCAGSVIVAHGLSCSAAYGIFPDQGSNPCPLHWQADSQPLRHQESPRLIFKDLILTLKMYLITLKCGIP